MRQTKDINQPSTSSNDLKTHNFASQTVVAVSNKRQVFTAEKEFKKIKHRNFMELYLFYVKCLVMCCSCLVLSCRVVSYLAVRYVIIQCMCYRYSARALPLVVFLKYLSRCCRGQNEILRYHSLCMFYGDKRGEEWETNGTCEKLEAFNGYSSVVRQ